VPGRCIGNEPKGIVMGATHEIEDTAGAQRRGFLKCMLWAGTGVVWTVSGGVPRSALLGGPAMAVTPPAGELTSCRSATAISAVT
jgi:hypothetical protein